MSYKTNPKVYIDVQIGASGAGRIMFELFIDLTPKTAENFRGLCTGEYGKINNIKLHYLNSKFHKISDGFVIQGGDITGGGGTGGFSIYGRTFVDQNFARRHSCAGLLSMANTGRNSNSSQFFITLKPCPHLDGKHVVFGQVIDGMEIVRKMSKVPVDAKDKPKIPIIVVDCGQIQDFKDFLKYDPFKKSVFDQIREKKTKIVEEQHKIRKLLQQGIDPNSMYDHKTKLEKCDNQLRELQEKEIELYQNKGSQSKLAQTNNINITNTKVQDNNQSIETGFTQVLRQKFKESQIDKLLDMRLKVNEARKLNSNAVLQEQMQQNDINYYKTIKKQEWMLKRKHQEEELEAKGIKEDKLYLNRTTTAKDESEKKQTFGWNIFTEDALYKAYEKRCNETHVDHELYEKMKNDPNVDHKPSEEALDKLAQDVQKQIEKRAKFSRRRMFDDQQIVTYVNERNRIYNKKLDRSFGKYAQNIKTALQMNNQK